MSKLEEHMKEIINIFHQYSVQMGHPDTLSKGEMKQLLMKELPNTIQNARDRGGIDKIFQDLGENADRSIEFYEFLKLLSRLQLNTHKYGQKP
uniref:EF-hand domain-containing protein n=1 Tax=Otolemur garnettii TaxID=30611 RepID=H0X9K4_OTOGA